MTEEIAQTLKILPEKPGVYIMHDEAGKIIYVGKAVILRNRVRSYFRESSQIAPKVRALAARVRTIETIVTDNELEALILECNLIKQYRPRYNISLKDDKTYPYLKVTLSEQFPRVYVTRHLVKDGGKYYGPYANAGDLNTNLKLIRNLFPLRTCRKLNATRPCLQYHIGRCKAPCAGLISEAEYGEMIQSVLLYMEGKTGELEKQLKEKMQQAAADFAYEEAARYRDLIRAIVSLKAEQKAVTEAEGDQDAIALASDASGVCAQVFFIRRGKIVGRDNFFLPLETEEDQGAMLAGFLKQYYLNSNYIPKEIILSAQLGEEQEILATWLSKRRESKVTLTVPQRGFKHDLIQMVAENARKALSERLRLGKAQVATDEQAAEELQQALGLTEPLLRMDCFDISHTQGAETVASMVVFRNGSPSKKDYRKYKIRSAEGKPDDFKSMQEVVYRRYSKGEDLPSLIVIDGGKGQLSSALTVIRGLGLHEVPVIGLAKREEEIFTEGSSESIILSKESSALKLIQRLRDEAHRFAITYHRKLRGKRNLVSVLDHIPGIGPKRRQGLWQQFTSIEAMREATVEELAAAPNMNKQAAEAVYNFFRQEVDEKRKIAALTQSAERGLRKTRVEGIVRA